MFEIYTLGSGSYVVEALHAIKMFMGSDSYTTLVRLAGLVGLLWIMLAALRNKSGGTIQADWSWLLFFMFFYVGLLVPKISVAIIDPIDPPTGASPVVTNVPLGVGALAYITSQIGYGLTQKYETFISIPGDQKYAKNGMLFGANVMRSLGDMEFPDAGFASDMNGFIGHCLFPQMTTGNLSIDMFTKSTDLWMYLKSYAQTNRWIKFQDGSVHTCLSAAQNLDNRMPSKVSAAAAQAGQKIWPSRAVSTAQAAFLASAGGTNATDFIGIAQSGANLTRQAMMVRAVSGALESVSVDADNPAMAQAVYQAKAETQQRNMYITMGNMAARTLPIMKAVMESVSYAIAPLVFLFILMPGGLTALGQYALFLMWLQMWPILYAIINSVMYWYGSQGSRNASMLSDGSYGLTLETANSIFATNADMVALAGYMALSIPMISYMLLKGGMAAGGAVYSSLMQPANSTAAASANEQTAGTLTMNTMTMDTASWASMNANKMDLNSKLATGMSSVIKSDTGSTFTYTSGSDVPIVSMLKNDYAYSTQMNDAIKSSIATSARDSITAARQNATEYVSSTSSMLSTMQSFAHQVQASKSMQDTATQQQSTQLGQAVEKMDNLAKDFAANTGLSYQSSVSLLASVSNGGLNGQAVSDETYQEAVRFAEQSGYKQTMQSALQLANQLSATSQEGVSDTAAQTMQAALQQNQAMADKASASYQHAMALESLRSRMEESGISFSGDIGNLMRTRLGISVSEFEQVQATASQGNNPEASTRALQTLQGWVDQFVSQGGAAELVGLKPVPTADGVHDFYRDQQAAVRNQGEDGVYGSQQAAFGKVGSATGQAGLDLNQTAPSGYYGMRDGVDVGTSLNEKAIAGQREDISTTGAERAELVGNMSNKGAAEAAAARAKDLIGDTLPESVYDVMKSARDFGVEGAAAITGGINAAVNSVDRFVSGKEQNWDEDYAKGQQWTKDLSAIKGLTSEDGSSFKSRDKLFTNNDDTEKKSPVTNAVNVLGKNIARYDNIIQEAAERHNVPANLLRAMMKQESEGNPNATSHKGAGGLMQLMPETAAEVARKHGMKDFDRYNPRDNIMAGAAYMRQQLSKYKGDINLALAAYNAGSGNVDKHGGVPPFKETQDYVAKITKTYRKLESKDS